ncbi:MAG: type II toxin-antitoxin system VapC family toxin [Deltaproteobacteria bacterium]|nr:type II toxin-antitoxin system VapC family toxin [Deltaproteobacteria bacterium]
MRIFLDTSALAKRYVKESGSEKVHSKCQKAREIVLSILCVPEMLSAFNRLRRQQALSIRQYDDLKTALSEDIAQATVLGLEHAVLSQAILCLETEPLRTLDAIHIATAKEARIDLFISADRKQCKAATALGLKTEFVK